MAATVFTEPVNEGTDSECSCQFVEAVEGNPAIEAGAILSIAATLKDVKSGLVINSREDQNVLNAAGGTLGLDGTFTLQLSGADDNVIVETSTTGSRVREKHRLTLAATYSKTGGGTGHLNHEFYFYVLSLADVEN